MMKIFKKVICFTLCFSMMLGAFVCGSINSAGAKAAITQKKILMVIAPKDFEDCEVVEPMAILQANGAKVQKRVGMLLYLDYNVCLHDSTVTSNTLVRKGHFLNILSYKSPSFKNLPVPSNKNPVPINLYPITSLLPKVSFT